jgi:hypothetical protein
MTAKEWRQVLLNGQDSIIFAGTPTRLIARSLGFGVVEVSKQPEGEKETAT